MQVSLCCFCIFFFSFSIFNPSTALAQVLGLIALRFADDRVLPFNFTDYAGIMQFIQNKNYLRFLFSSVE